MTRNRILFFAVSALLVIPLFAGTFLSAAGATENDEDSIYKYLSVFTDVLNLVRGNYVEVTDAGALMAGAFDGTTDALDPFSLYVPPEAVESYLAARLIGQQHSGLLVLRERGVVYVAGVVDGSPAAAADVRVGDIIASVGDEETRTMPLWQVQQALTASERSLPVRLLRLGETIDVTLDLGPFEATRPSLRDERGVAVLRIPTFGTGSAELVQALLSEASDARQTQLVIDLRGVSAGAAEEAYRVAGFLAPGDLGWLDDRGERLEAFSNETPPIWQGRIVVLVDRGTLGAAEVLATVLKQTLGAELVGERTFGYAGRQEIAELSFGGRLLYTGAYYTGPDGTPLTESLDPDLRVDHRPSREAEDGEEASEDSVLERGLSLILGEEELAS